MWRRYRGGMTIHDPSDSPSSVPSRDGITYIADREIAAIGTRLLDDAYMAWFLAQHEADEALGAWFDPGARSRALAYRTYCAAVDREEAAARDLQRLTEISAPCVELLG